MSVAREAVACKYIADRYGSLVKLRLPLAARTMSLRRNRQAAPIIGRSGAEQPSAHQSPSLRRNRQAAPIIGRWGASERTDLERSLGAASQSNASVTLTPLGLDAATAPRPQTIGAGKTCVARYKDCYHTDKAYVLVSSVLIGGALGVLYQGLAVLGTHLAALSGVATAADLQNQLQGFQSEYNEKCMEVQAQLSAAIEQDWQSMARGWLLRGVERSLPGGALAVASKDRMCKMLNEQMASTLNLVRDSTFDWVKSTLTGGGAVLMSGAWVVKFTSYVDGFDGHIQFLANHFRKEGSRCMKCSALAPLGDAD